MPPICMSSAFVDCSAPLHIDQTLHLYSSLRCSLATYYISNTHIHLLTAHLVYYYSSISTVHMFTSASLLAMSSASPYSAAIQTSLKNHSATNNSNIYLIFFIFPVFITISHLISYSGYIYM